MKNRQKPSMGGSPEHNEPISVLQEIEREDSLSETSEGQLLVDYLLGTGFTGVEAEKLVNLREHLYENAEMCQRMADDCRLAFARWLYEQGEISQ